MLQKLKIDNYIQQHITNNTIITLICVVIVKTLKIVSFVFLVSLLFPSVIWQNQQILHHPAEDSAVEKEMRGVNQLTEPWAKIIKDHPHS